MDYDNIFEAYYNLYRLEADTPNNSDDEYKIGVRLANEAVNRWEGYDHTYWRELFTNVTDAPDGDTSVTAGTFTYNAPSDFKEVGGFVKLRDGAGALRDSYRIIEPQDAQFETDTARYCYFSGNPSDGFVLHLHPTPTTEVNGCTLDYIYYRTATRFTGNGSDATEMADPYFIVHRMLANRFRGSRNPYSGDAKADAEDKLKTMQVANNAGNWAAPWSLPDRSGSSWGS